MRHLLVIIASIVTVPPLAVNQSQQPWFFAVLSNLGDTPMSLHARMDGAWSIQRQAYCPRSEESSSTRTFRTG
jgi:hypothetical protein